MKNWKILSKIKSEKRDARREEIINVLLKNRGIMTKKQREEFFNPKISISALQRLVSKKQLNLALERIKKAIEKKEPVVIFGDYDCDGICGTAILWETLNQLGAKVKPYIPERVEGYGLSKEGIEKILTPTPSLIITVDNGITAHDAIDYASSLGIDVVVTDHHLLPKKLPKALAIVHTTKLSGAAVAWLLAQALGPDLRPLTFGLDLVSLATITDLVPLIGPSRVLTKIGLQQLNQTRNIGLKALISESGLRLGQIGVYEIGWILGPRLNATGRLASAMDSLRLLCFKDVPYVKQLAQKLSELNLKRQKLTDKAFEHAKKRLEKEKLPKLIFISHPDYNEGIVGLVASKLVEEFFRPAIVGTEKGDLIRASARSIPSFNITEAISKGKALLKNFGGHEMAAGLTVKKENLKALKEKILRFAESKLGERDLMPSLKVDCEVKLSDLNWKLLEKVSHLEPFGLGNPRPLFLTTGLQVTEARAVGNKQKHLKLKLDDIKTREIERAEAEVGPTFDGIGFNLGFWGEKLREGDIIDLVYNLDKNVWNGEEILQLKVKDLRKGL